MPTILFIDTFLVDLPTIRPHILSMATMMRQTAVFVRIQCADGIIGTGEATTIGGLSYGPESPEGIKLAIDTYFAPLLLSADAARPAMVMELLGKSIVGNHFAKCAVETALLDAMGQRLGVPVSELLGGRRRDTLPAPCRKNCDAFLGCHISGDYGQGRSSSGNECRLFVANGAVCCVSDARYGKRDMRDLTCWMYISTTIIPRAHAAQVIDAIVAVSRHRNAILEVTGALIFSGASFAQIIEGPADAIADLRASISHDVRHREILTMADGEQTRREFADWSLAYSGTSLFVARELDRISAARVSEPYNSNRDLRRLLGELAS